MVAAVRASRTLSRGNGRRPAGRRGPSGPPRVEQHVGQRYAEQRRLVRTAAVGEPAQSFGEHLVGPRLLAEQAAAEQVGGGGRAVGAARPGRA